MSPSNTPDIAVYDLQPDTATFLEEVLDGLQADEKKLPCKYFYDERGSRLFEEICKLDEYYLTRAELEILRANAKSIAEALGPCVLLVEPGAGSGEKVRVLLDHIVQPAGYMPIDISREHLRQSAIALSERYPDLEVVPVCADFSDDFDIPATDTRHRRKVAFFPGSTIGNFTPDDAVTFLGRLASLCGQGGAILLGADRKKSPDVLERAYNDSRCITEEFNKNVLHHANRKLEADFEPDNFRHHAFYNSDKGRIEMHLVSRKDQVVTIDKVEVEIREGESIRTECSYKYSIDDIRQLAEEAGLRVDFVWSDDEQLFSVYFLTVV